MIPRATPATSRASRGARFCHRAAGGLALGEWLCRSRLACWLGSMPPRWFTSPGSSPRCPAATRSTCARAWRVTTPDSTRCSCSRSSSRRRPRRRRAELGHGSRNTPVELALIMARARHVELWKHDLRHAIHAPPLWGLGFSAEGTLLSRDSEPASGTLCISPTPRVTSRLPSERLHDRTAPPPTLTPSWPLFHVASGSQCELTCRRLILNALKIGRSPEPEAPRKISGWRQPPEPLHRERMGCEAITCSKTAPSLGEERFNTAHPVGEPVVATAVAESQALVVEAE